MYDDEESFKAFNEHVLIFFLASEYNRLLEPLRKWNPSRVYIFIFEDETKDTNYKEIYPEIEKGIKDFNSNIEIIKRGVPFVEYYAVIQELSKIIEDERKNDKDVEILMNCSTGSKISAIATIDASRLWNVKALYVYSDDYNPTRKIKHEGPMKMIYPPFFPIVRPEWNLIETIRIIASEIEKDSKNGSFDKDLEEKNYFIMKSKLQDILEKRGMLKSKGQNDKQKEKTRKQMALKQQILDKLINQKLIRTEKKSKYKMITLTEYGRRISKIFKYYNPKTEV